MVEWVGAWVSQLRGTVFDSWRIMDESGRASDLKCSLVD